MVPSEQMVTVEASQFSDRSVMVLFVVGGVGSGIGTIMINDNAAVTTSAHKKTKKRATFKRLAIHINMNSYVNLNANYGARATLSLEHLYKTQQKTKNNRWSRYYL